MISCHFLEETTCIKSLYWLKRLAYWTKDDNISCKKIWLRDCEKYQSYQIVKCTRITNTFYFRNQWNKTQDEILSEEAFRKYQLKSRPALSFPSFMCTETQFKSLSITIFLIFLNIIYILVSFIARSKCKSECTFFIYLVFAKLGCVWTQFNCGKFLGNCYLNATTKHL